MQQWNVIEAEDKEADFILLNKSKTPIRLSKRARCCMPSLMDRMEEANVPISYTEKIQEIYLTFLNGMHGDYDSDKMRIRLSCDSESMKVIERTLVHEIAHHLDEFEELSHREDVIAEKKTRAKHLHVHGCKKNVDEYVASGFEIYYFGTSDERATMRKKNKMLYRAIARVHRKYSKR